MPSEAGGGTMTPRLRAVLARLCEKLGPIYKTQAVKLPYLVDVIANNVLGHPIAYGTYETWEHGVVAREVYRFIRHEPQTDSLFEVRPVPYSESGVKISLARHPAAAQAGEELLGIDELAVIDFVAEAYGSLPVEELGHLTKRLNTEISPDGWGANHEASVEEEAFIRLSPAWQNMCRRLSTENLDDRSRWSAPVNDDPMAHFLRALDA